MEKLTLTVTNQIDNQGLIFLSTPCGNMFSLMEMPYDKKSHWGFSIIKQGQHKVIDPQKIGAIIFPANSDGIVQEFLTS